MRLNAADMGVSVILESHCDEKPSIEFTEKLFNILLSQNTCTCRYTMKCLIVMFGLLFRFIGFQFWKYFFD